MLTSQERSTKNIQNLDIVPRITFSIERKEKKEDIIKYELILGFVNINRLDKHKISLDLIEINKKYLR